jgi:hypothetical protein
MSKQPKATTVEPTQSTFSYSPIPSATRLMSAIAAMPTFPASWEQLASYRAALDQWRDELERAAGDVCAAANDATGLMAQIIDGTRKVDEDATRMIAMVTAVRA